MVYNKKEEVINDQPPKGAAVGLTKEDKKWMLDNFATKAELKTEISNINNRLDTLVLKNKLKE